METFTSTRGYSSMSQIHIMMKIAHENDGYIVFEISIQIYTSEDRNTQLPRTQESQKYILYSKVTFFLSSFIYITYTCLWSILCQNQWKNSFFSCYYWNFKAYFETTSALSISALVSTSTICRRIWVWMRIESKENSINKNSAPQIQ